LNRCTSQRSQRDYEAVIFRARRDEEVHAEYR
jgi:hypothetical protein